LDGTPDGRPGWATYLVQEGYHVYILDRPGHGRSPFHPELHGAFPAQASTYEQMGRQFTAPEKSLEPVMASKPSSIHSGPAQATIGDPPPTKPSAAKAGRS